MGRLKQVKMMSHCVVCGDEATGFFFNALTCMSCRVFFRRNALRYSLEQLSCAQSDDDCRIDRHTRRSCTKCRLKKCLKLGMKKEWILTEKDKIKLYCRKKILLNRIARDLPKHENEIRQKIVGSENEIIDQIDQEYINSIVDEYCAQIDLNDTEDLDFELNIELQILSQSDSSLSSSDDDLPLQSQMFNLETSNEQEPTTQHDYITQCLLNDNFIDKIVDNNTCCAHDTIPPEINPFPSHELIGIERNLLYELSNACTLLSNPYRKIVDYGSSYCPMGTHPISQYTLERFVQMSKRLHSFTALCETDQNRVIRNSLLEMYAIRTVIIYDPDRDAFGIADDKDKVTAMISLQVLAPFCKESTLIRLRSAYKLFRDEWKQDGIIYSLLNAINLFTPKKEYSDYSRIKNEQTRYCRLLSRYLATKYETLEEAEQCYHQLRVSVNELLLLSVDLRSLFVQCETMLREFPLFSQFLDLLL